MKCPKCGNEPTLTEVQRSPGDCLKCGINYEGFSAARSKSHAAPRNRSRIPLVLMALLVVCGLGYGGYEGCLRYERQQFIDSAEGYVRGTTAHLQQMIETQRNPGAITFQELFNKSAKSVEEIDGFVVKVSMLDGQSDIKDAVIAYMKASQDVLRGVTSNWRGILAFSSAQDRIERAKSRYMETDNEYASNYAREAWEDAIEDSDKAMKEVREAKVAFNGSLAKARSASEALVWFSSESKPADGILEDI
jgi:flagellar hook-basal body complex protein FliE